MKKIILISIIAIILIVGGILLINQKEEKLDNKESNNEVTENNNAIIGNNNKLEAVVLTTTQTTISVQDKNNIIYTFEKLDETIQSGKKIVIEYEGDLNKNTEYQDIEIIKYTVSDNKTNQNSINEEWLDNGMYSQYYNQANEKLKTMTLDEKIGQLFLVRYTDDKTAADTQKQYQFGGYLFFAPDFKNKTEAEVQAMVKKVQDVSKIPLLTAVDEEGGLVVRVSVNSKLVPSRFLSPSDLYKKGGFELIKEDTINKSKVLYNLGLNLNLAPVVDISTSPTDYMYRRSLQQNAQLTATFATTVIKASEGTNVSYCLKHFPGYGNNLDTHIGSSVDDRTYESILTNDLVPFKEGIEAGAETVMISHNIVTSIDQNNPASLSPSIHNLLRNELNFTGIIITDGLDMGAIEDVADATVRSILSGNDLIITTDYKTSIDAVKNAINTGRVSEDLINKLCFRILAWKYSTGVIK